MHRAQISYGHLDLRTGQEVRGQIRPATRAELWRSEALLDDQSSQLRLSHRSRSEADSGVLHW